MSSELLDVAEAEILRLLSGAEAGRIVKDGLRAVVIGKPNTGKSSLFNALIGDDAAIVAASPGTTRDALEVWIDARGVPVLLTDTAGIRDNAGDAIEEIGIERAREQYRKADVSIFLLDGSAPLNAEDRAIARSLEAEKKLIVAINKSDLPQAFGTRDAAALLPFPFDEAAVMQISLIGDELGLEKDGARQSVAAQIGERLFEAGLGGAGAGASLLVTKARHKVLLEKAASEIAAARAAIAGGAAPEFAEVDIRAAWEALGEITGETATDDVIDRVFSEFCVGK